MVERFQKLEVPVFVPSAPNLDWRRRRLARRHNERMRTKSSSTPRMLPRIAPSTVVEIPWFLKFPDDVGSADVGAEVIPVREGVPAVEEGRGSDIEDDKVVRVDCELDGVVENVGVAVADGVGGGDVSPPYVQIPSLPKGILGP